MASKEGSESSSTRREFLKSVAGIGGVATASALVGTTASAGTQPDGAADRTRTSKGYHVTPHIEQYYRTASLL